MEEIGYALGIVLFFLFWAYWLGWIPYTIFCILRCIWGFILPEKTIKKSKCKTVKKPPKPPKPPKLPKRSYPVETSFNEEHRIINPIEFDD